MKRFIEGEDRRQATLLPDSLDDYVTEDNPVRVVDVFIDELELAALGFSGVVPELTGRPAHHPATLLKVYLYGYLNRIQSSRRLERESQRNIELMWLTGRLMPDFKLDLFAHAVAAIDGSKFKAAKGLGEVLVAGENDARAELARKWAHFTPGDRKDCVALPCLSLWHSPTDAHLTAEEALAVSSRR
jgi:hypothetical protein